MLNHAQHEMIIELRRVEPDLASRGRGKHTGQAPGQELIEGATKQPTTVQWKHIGIAGRKTKLITWRPA